MSANLLEKVTQGERLVGRPVKPYGIAVYGREGLKDVRICRGVVSQADADLIALAYDHALLLRAGALAVAQIASFEVGVAVDNEWVRFAVRLDAFGIPALTPELRTALEAAVRSANG